MTDAERGGDAGGEAAGRERPAEVAESADAAVAEDAVGVEAAVAEDAAVASDGAGSEAAPDATRVVEAPDEEELVAAPAWATLILVLAPFVVGLLVILALRWLL